MTHAKPAPPDAREVKAAVERLGRAFEEFKATNDIADVERRARGQMDAVLDEKLGRINTDLDRLQGQVHAVHTALSRPGLAAGGTSADPAAAEHKAAFYDGYVRKGLEAGLAGLQAKALTIGTDAEGGFAVPEQLDADIERRLRDVSPIRAIAAVVQIGSANYRKLVATTGAASGWVSETGARAETAAPTFAEVAPPLGEIYANPAATQSMLDDAFFDVEAWLAEELADEFGQKEGAAFVAGDGINKPQGFLTYPATAADDATRPFGTLQHVATGAAGAFPASDPSDVLIDLVHALRPVYRGDAAFVVNTNTLAAIRKFKDADGDYLWRPGLAEGAQATLLGYPVVEAEDMPDIALDSFSVAFGNFRRGYTVTDRTGTRVLRDPFSNKPFVHFYTTRRTGGGVVNSDALKLLKFAVS